MKFTADHVILLYQVKGDKTSDFESAWTTIKEKLAKSEKAELKQLGESLNVYKVNPTAGAAAAPAGPTVFVLDLHPVVKTQSYDIVQILYYSTAFPERPEADALYKKLGDSLAAPSVTIWPLAKIGG